MAVKAPALPPTIKTGLPAGGPTAEPGHGPGGTPMSDADVMSRLRTAAGGIDSHTTPAAEALVSPPIDPTAEEPADPSPADPGADPAPTDDSPGPDGTAPEDLDLDSGLPEETTIKREAKPPEPAADEPKDKPGKSSGKDLRSQLERFQGEARTLAKEKETLTKRLAELETKVKSAPDAKALADELTKREQKIADMEKHLAFLDYSQSQEFTEKYGKPYEAKLNETFKDLRTLVKQDGSHLSDQEVEQMVLGGEREAYRMIDESFEGGDSRLATRLVQDVYSLARDKSRALEQAKAEAQENRKKQQATRAQFQQQYKALFEQSRSDIAAKFPDLYGRDEKDRDRSDLLDAGYKLVDSAFTQIDKFSPEQRARIEAEIYHRAGAFPALRNRALRAEKELATAKAELTKFKGNAPGRGQPPEDGNASGKEPEVGSKEWIAKGLRASMGG